MAEDDRNKGKGGDGGKGGGDKGGNGPDTPFEVAASMVIERLMRVFGSRAADFVPDSVRNEVKRLARGRNLATAIRTLGRVAEIFGDDEEIRGAIRGFTDGVAGGFVTIEGDGKDVPAKMQAALDGNPDLQRLEALKAAGRFDGHRNAPFTEALTYLNPERRAAIVGILPFFNDGGLFLDAKFLARELQGMADLIIEMGGPSERVAVLVKRRFNPASPVEKALGTFEKIRVAVRKHLDVIGQGDLGVPFAPRLQAETNRQATGHANYEAAKERLRAGPSTRGPMAFLRRQWVALVQWRRNRRAPPPPVAGAGGPPPVP